MSLRFGLPRQLSQMEDELADALIWHFADIVMVHFKSHDDDYCVGSISWERGVLVKFIRNFFDISVECETRCRSTDPHDFGAVFVLRHLRSITRELL